MSCCLGPRAPAAACAAAVIIATIAALTSTVAYAQSGVSLGRFPGLGPQPAIESVPAIDASTLAPTFASGDLGLEGHAPAAVVGALRSARPDRADALPVTLEALEATRAERPALRPARAAAVARTTTANSPCESELDRFARRQCLADRQTLAPESNCTAATDEPARRACENDNTLKRSCTGRRGEALARCLDGFHAAARGGSSSSESSRNAPARDLSRRQFD